MTLTHRYPLLYIIKFNAKSAGSKNVLLNFPFSDKTEQRSLYQKPWGTVTMKSCDQTCFFGNLRNSSETRESNVQLLLDFKEKFPVLNRNGICYEDPSNKELCRKFLREFCSPKEIDERDFLYSNCLKHIRNNKGSNEDVKYQ